MRSFAHQLKADLGLVEVAHSELGGVKRMKLRRVSCEGSISPGQALEVRVLATFGDSFLGDGWAHRGELTNKCSTHGALVVLPTKSAVGAGRHQLASLSSILRRFSFVG